MPIEFGDLVGGKRWIEVEIGDQVLLAAYHPGSTSLRKQAEIQRRLREMQAQEDADEIQQIENVAAVFCEIVCDWDLTDQGRTLPITIETVTALPQFVYSAIMDAVTQDRQADGEEKKPQSARSGAGLPVEDKREIVQNGTFQSERRGTWA